MSDSTLSQDEIDALLSGTSGGTSTGTASSSSSGGESAYSAIIPVLKEALDSGANVAGTLLSKQVTLQTPTVNVSLAIDFSTVIGAKGAVFHSSLSGGLSGGIALVLNYTDAAKIADVMMGGDASAPPVEMDELYLSAVGEAMSQVVGAACTVLSKGRKAVTPTPTQVVSIDPGDDMSSFLGGATNVVCASFHITWGDLGASTLYLVLSEAVAKGLSGTSEEAQQPKPAVAQAAPPPPPPTQAQPKPAPQPTMATAPVAVQPVQFENLTPRTAQAMPANIDLLMDVPMQLTVELGRASMMIRDVLELGNGSIIELDKLAGEPVDLLVNGKLIARGEVVVIDENFGVRVTDIISPLERMKNLQ